MYSNIVVWFFGFISGFLLLITGNTLNFWVAKDGCSLETISLFSLVSLPYAANFLWAPIFDRFKLNLFKNNLYYRIEWLFLLHFLGIITLILMSRYNPSTSPKIIAIFAFFLSFINASQDLILNALRSELNEKNHAQENSGIYIFGYRSGMVLSGSFAIFASEYLSWNKIYLIFAAIYLTFPIILYKLKLHQILNHNVLTKVEQRLNDINWMAIIRSFGNLRTTILILLFLASYRIADNFISVMLNPFLIDQGFSESEIAIAGKFCGIIGAGFGGLIANGILSKYKIFGCLLGFALIHTISHASYILILYFGNSTKILIFATLAESITGGMTMAAYIALITKMCNGEYRATQYALLSAMMGVSRTILPSLAGIIVAHSNWTLFFILSIIMVIPSLILLNILKATFLEKNL